VYFDSLNSDDVKRKLETLKRITSTLVKHYTSQDAYGLALLKEKSVNASAKMKVPAGTHFTLPLTCIPEEPQPMTARVGLSWKSLRSFFQVGRSFLMIF